MDQKPGDLLKDSNTKSRCLSTNVFVIYVEYGGLKPLVTRTFYIRTKQDPVNEQIKKNALCNGLEYFEKNL